MWPLGRSGGVVASSGGQGSRGSRKQSSRKQTNRIRILHTTRVNVRKAGKWKSAAGPSLQTIACLEHLVSSLCRKKQGPLNPCIESQVKSKSMVFAGFELRVRCPSDPQLCLWLSHLLIPGPGSGPGTRRSWVNVCGGKLALSQAPHCLHI